MKKISLMVATILIGLFSNLPTQAVTLAVTDDSHIADVNAGRAEYTVNGIRLRLLKALISTFIC